MIGIASRKSSKAKMGIGEYQAGAISPDGTLWGLGNVSTRGSGGGGSEAVPLKFAVIPSTTKFKAVFGSLHGLAAITKAGDVWTSGDNVHGQLGVGDTNFGLNPQQILTDINGNPFTGVKQMAAFFPTPTQNNGWLAIKEDGTLWGWGQMKGFRGDGTDLNTLILRPTQITIPGGRLAQQIVAGYVAVLLCTDGTVWTFGSNGGSNLGRPTTGGDYASITQITSLTNVTQIAGGLFWNYAVKKDGSLWGWGNYSGHMCNPNGDFAPISTPQNLTIITNVIGTAIVKIVTSSVCTYAITSDGRLWSWGGNECGTIGNGEELQYDPDLPNYSGQNFGWNFNDGQLVVRVPYNVCPGKRFTDVWGSTVFTFYTYALDVSGQFYGWGRNKGSIIANKVENACCDLNSHFANAWDCVWPTPVDPFSATTRFIATCPYCIAHPSFDVCPQYTIPANTAPTANAGPDQSISTTSTQLDGTASSDNVYIQHYLWTQTSGPNTASIDLPASATPTVSGLVNGIYIFQLKVTDIGWLTATDTVSITKS